MLTTEEHKKYREALRKAKFKDFEGVVLRLFIIDKLRNNNWDRTRTADTLGIDRSTLHRYCKKFNIHDGIKSHD